VRIALRRLAICDDDDVTTQCADCGFIYDLTQAGVVPEGIRRQVGEVVTILRNDDVDRRSRRNPNVWSPLEYGCHLRDMLLVQRERVLAARRVARSERPMLARGPGPGMVAIPPQRTPLAAPFVQAGWCQSGSGPMPLIAKPAKLAAGATFAGSNLITA
jgi:hypothetical protein